MKTKEKNKNFSKYDYRKKRQFISFDEALMNLGVYQKLKKEKVNHLMNA